MRTFCPNLEREDGLETVLEVPIPEEMFGSYKNKPWQTMKSWMMKPQVSVYGGADIQFLLGVIGAPLVPIPIRCDRTINDNIKDCPIECSLAKYIVQQYIAAVGGEHALNSIDSIYAMGKVKMAASETVTGEDFKKINNTKAMKMKNMKNEIGGFTLWQKSPDLWSFELMVSGCKISAGSDGKVAWRQTPWQHSHASRGPPRPIRRSLQGLDPQSTANLFSNSICIGEKTINGEDCFVLKLESDPSTLTSRSTTNVEIIRHTIWGCFSQKTGLLTQLEDSHLLRIKSPTNELYWETTMETLVQDYRTIDGVNIAHAGKTSVSLFRFGENEEGHSRTRMEEIWSIEDVGFNVRGLTREFFLAPSDLKKDEEECGIDNDEISTKNGGLRHKILAKSSRIMGAKSGAKVVAIDEESLELFGFDKEL